MSSKAFTDAAARHRQAIEAVRRTLASVPLASWEAPAGPGKWSPAEIAEHLCLSYDPLLAELDGGSGYSLRLKGWKRLLARWRYLPTILEHGRFPEGVPAPREARPSSHPASPAAASIRLAESASRFERRLTEAHASGPVRLTHAYFGKLSAPQVLRLLAAHARHHAAQLPAAPARIGP